MILDSGIKRLNTPVALSVLTCATLASGQKLLM